MAINLYNGFYNKITLEQFRCISFDSNAFTIEWTLQPNGYVPFEHIHINQDEVFHIKTGEIRLLIEDREYIGKAGDSITVPRGKRHVAFNNKAAVLTCWVEYKPGLDTYTFFQCFGGLTIDEDMNKKGQISIPRMCYFTKKMRAQCITRPTSIPAPVFDFVINCFYIIGLVLGWKKFFVKYTDVS